MKKGYYTYTVSNGKATITDCDISISGNITIPKKLGGYPVTIIGDYAFKYCKKITNLTIPAGIRSIDKSAFGFCTGLKEVYISKGVVTIGDSAFYQCTKIEKLTLPNTVLTIGEQAFAFCESLTELNIPDSVVVIGQSAFTNCYGILNINIGKGVTTIENRAFFRCESVQEIIVPDTVTYIGSEVFSRCESLTHITLSENVNILYSRVISDCPMLKEITLSDNVTKIGRYAFSGCTALESITIPSSVNSINDYAFKSCENVTIHTSKGSYAEEFAISKGIPVIYFKEAVLTPSVEKTHDVNIPISYVEYSTGKSISLVDSQFDLKKLTVNKSGYYGIDIEDYTLDIHGLKKLALVPTYTNSNISAVHANGKDILVSELKTTDNNNTTVRINIYAAKDINVAKYQLLQKTTVIAESKDGLITFDSNKVQTSDEFYVRIIDTNGKAYNKIKINYENEAAIDIDFDLDNILQLTIPDNIPLIGGNEVELSLDNLPINAKVREDSVYVALGTSYKFSEDEDETGFTKYCNIIEEITKAQSNVYKYRDAKELRSYGIWKDNSDSDFGITISACGYAQIQFDSYGKPILKSGKLLVSFSASHEFEWQTVIVAVPILVKVKGEIGADASITLGLADNGKMYVTGELDVTLPKITASAGVGIAKVADISIYGSAKNNVYINFRVPYTTATLSGELGISGKVLFWSGKFPILQGSWEYYNSQKVKSYALRRTVMSEDQIINSIVDEMSYSINRDYLNERTAWNSEPEVKTYSLRRDTNSGYSVTTVQELQSGIYDGAKPQTVILNNGARVMVWTEDIENRSNYNHTAVVYSVYDPDLKYWSEPKIVSDDGTADFNPSIATDGENVVVAWSNTNKQIDGEADMSIIASACEISYAEFDLENAEFTKAVNITNDGNYDLDPKVLVNDSNIYISWVKNIENSPLTLEGENEIYLAEIAEDCKITEVSKFSTPITEQSIGVLNGKLCVAFVTDSDGDYLTEDSAVYLYNGEKISVLSDFAEQGNLVFSKLNGSNLLYWYKNSNLVAFDGEEYSVLIENFGVTDFNVISGNDQTAVIYSKQNSEDETGSSGLYAAIFGKDGFSKPVCINQEDGVYADSADGYIDENGNYRIVFVRKNVTITSSDITEFVTLCDAIIVPNFDISLENVFYSEDSIMQGENMTVTAVVKNNGLNNAEGIRFTVTDESGNEIFTTDVDVTIGIGESKEIEFNLPFPNVTKPTDFNFKASLIDGEETEEYDNSATITLGYSDISLSVENIVSANSQGTLLTVTNNGRTEEKVTLKIYEDSKDGKLLGVYELGTVKANSTVYYNYSAQKLRFLNSRSDILYLEVSTNSSEKYESDNSGYITYKTAMLDTLKGTEIEYYYDMNDDETFDVLDLIRTVNMLSDNNTEEIYSGRDVTGDEILNSIDLTAIRAKLWELF